MFLSLLYQPKKNHALKRLYNLTNKYQNKKSEGAMDNSLDVFLLHIDLTKPLEFLSIRKDKKDLFFIRQLNAEKSSQNNLYSSEKYLYLQLNELNSNKIEIQDLLNNCEEYKLPKPYFGDINLYELNKGSLIHSGEVNTTEDCISIRLHEPKLNYERNEIEPEGLHFFLSDESNLLSFVQNNIINNAVQNLSLNYFGINAYKTPIFFPDVDFLFQFEKAITPQEFIAYFTSTFFDDPKIIYTAESKLKAYGTLKIDDVAFSIKKFNQNTIYIGTSLKDIGIKKTNSALRISGNLAQLFKFNDNGWRTRLAREVLTSVPLLKQLNKLFMNTLPVTTNYNEGSAQINIKFGNKTSVYTEILNLISSALESSDLE